MPLLFVLNALLNESRFEKFFVPARWGPKVSQLSFLSPGACTKNLNRYICAHSTSVWPYLSRLNSFWFFFFLFFQYYYYYYYFLARLSFSTEKIYTTQKRFEQVKNRIKRERKREDEATREIHLHVVISRSPAGRHPQLRFGSLSEQTVAIAGPSSIYLSGEYIEKRRERSLHHRQYSHVTVENAARAHNTSLLFTRERWKKKKRE